MESADSVGNGFSDDSVGNEYPDDSVGKMDTCGIV